ncbi:sensor histidine kinase [Paenibacillus sp. NFR01]|uniref:sensor histidine kinase n=1 Tax=Paenibacillus sp. NFR01 TaxID=1566279 RepID=UPI0008AD39A7|nr:HAMP domain-containing sensor histidine kinase [Paenibacillus sp. NFR01]SEU10771.1 Histidine kinase-, DNA gyrase B-, and HSP90-like ATPase [Paenibacillus sp. NFR01]
MFIFLVFVLFIAISGFLLMQRKYTKATLFMLLMGFSYLIVISCIIIYMSKDAYYYYRLKDFFGLKQSMLNQLMFLPVSRFALIRLLNFFSVTFLYAGLCSAIYFAFHVRFKRGVLLLTLLAVPGTVQVLLYDPGIYTRLYYWLYPAYLSPQAFNAAYGHFHRVTFAVNTLYIAAGMLLLGYALYAAPKVRQIQSNIMMILLSYLSVQVTYYYINYWSPDVLIKVSKAMDFTRYKPINLVGNPSIYSLLPYLTGFCLLISLYSIYRYTRIQNSIKNQEAVISKNIDSALFTSRVFSHYIKNELLAIMAQTEFIEGMPGQPPELAEEIQVIEQRCRKIYDRLDVIHQKTLKAKVELVPSSLNELLAKLLDDLQPELKMVQAEYAPPTRPLVIMADAYYFAQAVGNIIANAADALEFVPEKSRKLTIETVIKNKWVELVIADNGPGMPEEHLRQIFQPFYSSKPTATNWGMGLSITHTIITAHGGKISAESKPGEGSVFRIIMPLL